MLHVYIISNHTYHSYTCIQLLHNHISTYVLHDTLVHYVDPKIRTVDLNYASPSSCEYCWTAST